MGEFIHRNFAPAMSLSQSVEVSTLSLHQNCPEWVEVMKRADVVILHMVYQSSILDWVGNRCPTDAKIVFEISDLITQPTGFDRWDTATQELLKLLRPTLALCDGLQFTSPEIEREFTSFHKPSASFVNHLLSMPPLPYLRRKTPLQLGWGGSVTHLQDIAEILPAIQIALESGEFIFQLMAPLEVQNLVKDTLQRHQEQLVIHQPSSLTNYYSFLQALDLGICPVMKSKFNAARTDIKFIEYASRGVVTLAPKLPPYHTSVIDGETGWLYQRPDELPSILDNLAKNPASLTYTRLQAYQHVKSERLLSLQHNENRLGFYRQICPSPKASSTQRLNDIEAIMRKTQTTKRTSQHLMIYPT